MRFLPTELAGAWIIELDPVHDDRGFFARSWCRREFESRGLNPRLAQCNISFNHKRGIIRGMHYQAAPHEEAKLVRCTRGAIYDVVLDLRQNSPTFKRWTAFELHQDNWTMLYVGEGFAHGFQTLQDRTEVFYQMSESFHPELSRGIRWNDPELAIDWPVPNPALSDRDRNLPLLTDCP
jgi:dTDP-4-dehydrorhamnose 3,5-epimerase